MSDLLVVFGATGQQGGSVAHFVLADPELSKKYNVRALCRDTSKPTAQALLQQGAELATVDLDDETSIRSALQGAHTVYSMTRTIYDEHAYAREFRQAKAVADAAVAVGAQLLIFSTAMPLARLSGGKFPSVAYDSKADAETYIRSLSSIKSAFVAPGSFMQNFTGMMSPRRQADGTYLMANVHSGKAVFPWLDVAGDNGKFVGAILADPERFEGKVLHAAEELLSMDEAAEVLSRATGKTIRYATMPEEAFRAHLPPTAKDDIVNMFYFIEKFGYYGADTRESVAWAQQKARGKLTSLEAYLQANPLKL